MKLVASARRTTGGTISRPGRTARTADGHICSAALDGGANALILQTDLLDRIAMCQLSGGLTQTAYALLTDLITIARRARRRR